VFDMNKVSRFAVLGATLAASASFAYADSISLGSFATGTTAASLGFSASQTAMNFAGYTAYASPPAVASTPTLQNGTAATYALNPTSVWTAPIGNSSWVGDAMTAGPGGTNPPYGYYQFTTSFTAAGGPDYSGSISLMADDTVEVLLNGLVLVPFGALGSDLHCAVNDANCTVADVVPLSGVTLLSGNDANVFTFIVEQAGIEGNSVDPSGLDFTASLSAPEPGSLILLGTGLLGGAGLLLRRRRRDNGAD
jgi:hypothetical protein